jgi:hypothetical protein
MGVAMRRSIADYHSLLVQNVSQKYTAEAREDLYERARTALNEGLDKLDPPPSYEDLVEERLKLDFAIHNLEWSIATETSYAKSA